MNIPTRILLVFLALIPCSAPAQCGSAGLLGIPRITLTGKAVDRMIKFRLEQGHPGSDWVCFLDSSPGPIPTPFGPLCVGPGAIDIFNTFTGSAPLLDAAGSASIPVFLPPALGVLEGVPFSFQALVADPSTTSGISISEGRTHTFRRPRVFIGAEIIGPDYFTSIDPSTGTFDFDNQYGNRVREILPIPGENLVAILEGSSNFWLLDDETGATVYNDPQSSINHMALGRDERTLVLHVQGAFFFVPGSIRTLDVVTLAEQDTPLTIIPADIFAHPHRDVVYLATSDQVHRFDYAANTSLPPIPTGLAPGSSPPFMATEVPNQWSASRSGDR